MEGSSKVPETPKFGRFPFQGYPDAKPFSLIGDKQIGQRGLPGLFDLANYFSFISSGIRGDLPFFLGFLVSSYLHLFTRLPSSHFTFKQ